VSYRNIYYDAKERCVNLFTWDEDGKRIKVKASYDLTFILKVVMEMLNLYLVLNWLRRLSEPNTNVTNI